MSDPGFIIDWSTFDAFPESTCTCRCGTRFRSHTKFVMADHRTHTRKPCPNCRRDDDCWQIQGDPETYDL